MTDLIGEEKSLRQIKTPTKKEAFVSVLIQLIGSLPKKKTWNKLVLSNFYHCITVEIKQQ